MHPLAQTLLRGFEDVLLMTDTKWLPLLRDIKHQFDFLSNAPLLSKLTYMCNPHESKVLQRQVQELLDHGYVTGNMSPCLVPTILVHKKDGLSVFVLTRVL